MALIDLIFKMGNKQKIFTISKTLIRLFVGLMFIVAAVLKLLTVDSFELYIYSFNIFGYGIATMLSRMLIASEIIIGLGLILKIRYKEVWSLAMFALIGFTLFLFYVILFRNDHNCHCFGDIIRLNPAESIMKNLVSILLLLFIRNEYEHHYRMRLKKWLVGLLVAVALIFPFVVFPMDSVYNIIASKDNNIDTIEFDNSLKDPKIMNLLRFETENDSIVVRHDTIAIPVFTDDCYIVSFVSAGCNFCKFGADKLSMVLEHNNINKKHLKFLVWGYDADIVEFMNETETMGSEYWFISPIKSLDITYGRFPIYVWLDHGTIVASGDLRDLNESKIVEFLAK